MVFQLDDMEAERMQELNAAAAAEGADDEAKARCGVELCRVVASRIHLYGFFLQWPSGCTPACFTLCTFACCSRMAGCSLLFCALDFFPAMMLSIPR